MAYSLMFAYTVTNVIYIFVTSHKQYTEQFFSYLNISYPLPKQPVSGSLRSVKGFRLCI